MAGSSWLKKSLLYTELSNNSDYDLSEEGPRKKQQNIRPLKLILLLALTLISLSFNVVAISYFVKTYRHGGNDAHILGSWRLFPPGTPVPRLL